MIIMDDRRKLFLEALSENASDINLTPSDLQQRWARIVADAQAWRAALEALDEPRRGRWLGGATAALGVVIGAARGTSRIVDQAVNALLPMAADPWQFRVASVTRGTAAQMPSADAIDDGLHARIVIDDRREPKRAVAVVSGLGAAAEAPTLLILSVHEDGSATAREVAATITETTADGARTARYEAPLGEGRHQFYWGYPQPEALPGN
jgi:hypothetical protein